MSEFKKYDGFDDWADVQERFEMSQSEPEVIAAHYDGGGYDGTAIVIYKDGNQYGYVTGNHCSCYNLEGQWEPEVFESKELFLAFLKKQDSYWGPSALNHAIAILEKHLGVKA